MLNRYGKIPCQKIKVHNNDNLALRIVFSKNKFSQERRKNVAKRTSHFSNLEKLKNCNFSFSFSARAALSFSPYSRPMFQTGLYQNPAQFKQNSNNSKKLSFFCNAQKPVNFIKLHIAKKKRLVK